MNRRTRLFVILIAFALVAIALVLLMRAQRQPAPAPEIKQEQRDQTPALKQEEALQPTPRRQSTPLPVAPAQQPTQEPQEQVPLPTPTPDPEPHQRVTADVAALRTQIEDYVAKTGAYPTSVQGLSVLGNVPKDPWQRDYYYQSPIGTRNRVSYDLFSFGPDGMADTPDDDWGDDSESENPPNQLIP